MLSVRGIPQLYAGEEIAMEGKEDPDNRRDFPGGFPGDARNAFLPGGRTSQEQDMWQWTRNWIEMRRKYSAIRNGQLTDLYFDDDSYVFSRHNQEQALVIAINRSPQTRKLSVDASGFADATTLSPLFGQVQPATVRANKIELEIPSLTAVPYLVNKGGGTQ